MLNSVDLFSGIGGFTLAFKDVFTPLLYCDNDHLAKAVLQSRMRSGDLPTATIVDDVGKVSEIKRCVGKRKVHMLTAGFPCVGFSTSGSREGLENKQSGLFFDLMSVVRALQPDILFLENVAEVLTVNGGADFGKILKALAREGYDLRWSVLSCQEAGSPQLRRRWFCLCLKRGSTLTPLKLKARRDLDVWTRPMPTLVCDRQAQHSRRFAMLGNALVPMVARLAFVRLLSGFEICCISEMTGVVIPHPPTKGTISNGNKKVKHGSYTRGVIMAHNVQEKNVAVDVDVELDPTFYDTERQYQANPSRSPLPAFATQKQLTRFPTPRKMSPTHSYALNERTIRDLATVAMFASQVNGVKQKITTDSQGINPEFVEWLMGFPRGHTEF